MKRILELLDSMTNLKIPSGFQTLSITDATGGVGFTGATYAGATHAFMILETAQIRWTIDGTAPTTTVGHLLEIGQSLTLTNFQQIANFRGRRTGGTSGSLSVTFSKNPDDVPVSI